MLEIFPCERCGGQLSYCPQTMTLLGSISVKLCTLCLSEVQGQIDEHPLTQEWKLLQDRRYALLALAHSGRNTIPEVEACTSRLIAIEREMWPILRAMVPVKDRGTLADSYKHCGGVHQDGA